jgi:hypothetical protein
MYDRENINPGTIGVLEMEIRNKHIQITPNFVWKQYANQKEGSNVPADLPAKNCLVTSW